MIHLAFETRRQQMREDNTYTLLRCNPKQKTILIRWSWISCQEYLSRVTHCIRRRGWTWLWFVVKQLCLPQLLVNAALVVSRIAVSSLDKSRGFRGHSRRQRLRLLWYSLLFQHSLTLLSEGPDWGRQLWKQFIQTTLLELCCLKSVRSYETTNGGGTDAQAMLCPQAGKRHKLRETGNGLSMLEEEYEPRQPPHRTPQRHKLAAADSV